MGETLAEEVGLKMGLCFGRGFQRDTFVAIDSTDSSPCMALSWALLMEFLP